MRIFTKSFLAFLFSGLLLATHAASLDGIVADGMSGDPISDALVWAYPVNSNSIVDSAFYEAVTDENGHYYFDFLPGGMFRITAQHPDYYESSAAVESVDGEIALKQDFKLRPRKHYYDNSVSGLISDCVTGNPLGDVNVVLYSVSDDPNIINAISDNRGHYKFTNILPGLYHLIAFKRGYQTFKLDRQLAVRENTHIEDIDFVMLHKPNDAPGRLTGYVFAHPGVVPAIDSVRAVRDLLITPPPVYPARVELFRVTDDIATYYHSAWTNPDGSYRIRGITPGDFQVIVRARGYIAYRGFVTIESGHNEKIFYLKAHPNRYGKISGKVFFDKSEEPVSGAMINFISLSDRSLFNHTFTNDDGEYKARLRPGRYFVSCSYLGQNLLDTLTVSDTLNVFRPDRCGYYREYYDNVQSIADAKRIPVYSGSEITGIDFGLPDYLGIEKFSVSGIVLSEDGSAVADAEVRVYLRSCFNRLATDPNHGNVHDRYFSTRSADDGTYSIKIEKKLWYAPFIIVSAHKEGFRPQFFDHKKTFYEADRIRINTTEINDVNFDLRPEPQHEFIMAGQITNPDNEPVAAAFIITGNANNGQIYFAFSNNLGFYTFNGLPGGTYYTLFVAFGYGPELWDDATCWADADPIVLDHDIYNINAELQPVLPPGGDGTITGRIVDRNGLALSGVLLTAHNSDDQLSAYAFSDAKGDYTLAGLAGGEYQLEAGKASYQATDSRVYMADGQHATVIADLQITQNTVTAIDIQEAQAVPKNIFLGNNYPNPFNPSTKIDFGLSQPSNVRLTVYNILGQQVKVLIDSYLQAGSYNVEWNGQDISGRSVSSGLYLLMLETNEQSLMQKMILAK